MPLSYATPPLSILIADDDGAVLVVLASIFRSDGHQIGLAGDGLDALKLFSEKKWHVVVTDRHMPSMDGETLAREIKKLSPHIPVIMVTGQAPANRAPGVDAIIQKPFLRAELAEAITRCLAAAPAEAAASLAEEMHAARVAFGQ